MIAALGFTGQSTGLHFHVADANSPLGAEGLPFVLERFEVLGAYPDVALLGKAPWVPLAASAASARRGEMPAPNAVVRFPSEISRTSATTSLGVGQLLQQRCELRPRFDPHRSVW